MPSGARRLVLVLGDQLDRRSAAFDGFDPAADVVWMAEVEEEAARVPSHRLRLVTFFSAMRHHRDRLRAEGFRVRYQELGPRREDDRGGSFAEVLAGDVRELRPQRAVAVEPGDWRVRDQLEAAARGLGLPLELRPDRHFYAGADDFASFESSRKQLVLEHFYRVMRRRHGLLLEPDGGPVGGQWNLDAANRESFGSDGPGAVPGPPRFEPDEITRTVVATVRARFPGHPGSLDHVALVPLTEEAARVALEDFLDSRLPRFGTWQDAIWEGEPFLFHSRLAVALNLKLLDPRACVDGAVAALERGRAPLNAVEGFVRQVLGWREFVRGIYWSRMPGYAGLNALGCDPGACVPAAYWDGESDMACVRDAMRSLIDHGYAHHIVRLMVLGLYAQLLGVHPFRFHEWHLAMYLDAVDWVSLPNTLGMSQYGDGGVVGSKPYCASGAYVDRMSNHCKGCRFEPRRATGDDACPLTTLYWDFLARHRDDLAGNRRMHFQLANLNRKDRGELGAIRRRAARLRDGVLDGGR